MFRRRQVKTHTRLAKEELNESFGHLRMAAAHAADGAAGALAPRVDAARKAVKPQLNRAKDAAYGSASSLLDVADKGSRKAKRMARKGKYKVTGKKKSRMSGKRWPVLIGGLVAAGTAIGAATAILRKRRSQQLWDEYGSTRTTSDTDSVLGSAKNTMNAGIDKASAAASAAKDRATDLIGSKSNNSGPNPASTSNEKSMADASPNNNSRP